MKKSIIFIGCLYLVSCGDYHLSNYMFKEYCADKGLVGQFVYEQEKLSDDFFREIPKENKDRIGISGDFYIDNKKYLIDADKFEKHYSITYVKLDQLSKIGPIYAKETSVVKKMGNC